MTTKTCCKCKANKPLEDFNKKTASKDGLERYCRECHKEHNRTHYKNNPESYRNNSRNRRAANKLWFDEYKKTLACEKCGENRAWVLDFHHTDPLEKEGNVSEMRVGGAIDKIKEEIAKCQVLCKNCHADTHYQLKLNPV